MGFTFLLGSYSGYRNISVHFIINKFFLFNFILFPSLILFPQKNVLHFEHLSVEQGLSQSIVTSIVQDKNGFLWFGTEDGLNCYDGYQFKVYKNDPDDSLSLSDNGIMCLYKDRKKNIWIGTDKRGLNKYDYKTGKFLHVKFDKDFSGSKVNSVCQDMQENFWIGTDRGLFQCSPEMKLIKKYLHNPIDANSLTDSNIRSVVCDRDGDIWVGTENGLNKFDLKNKTIKRFFSSFNLGKVSLPISNLFEDREGYIWIGTFSNGVFRLNKSTGEFISYTNILSDETSLSANDVRKIFEDKEGNLWIGTANGLNRFVHHKNSFIRYLNQESDYKSLSCNEVISIYQDNDGIIWIGTFSGGINKLDLKQETFHQYTNKQNDPKSLSENYVTSVAEDKFGNIWVGTNFKGLNKLDKQTGSFTHFINKDECTNCISQNTVLSLANKYSDYLWIGTYLAGLCRLEIETGKFNRYTIDPNGNPNSTLSGTVYSLVEDNKNNVWIGTRNGLDKLDINTNRFIHFRNSPDKNSISDDMVITLLYDEYVLWIGTARGGLNRLDTRTNIISYFVNSHGNKSTLSSNRVQAIFKEADDTNSLWIGTDKGLNKFDKATGKFLRLNDDLLKNISIFAIISDNRKNLWLSTDKGIIKFNPATHHIKHFRSNDGLLGNEFEPNACIKDRNGFIYLGGPAGLNVFHPDNIKTNTYVPPVVLTSFKTFNKEVIFNKPLSEVDSINLTYEDDVISFEFAALSYAQPNLNRYAYYLDGFDRNWTFTDAGKRFVTYTNLKPGNYILKIKAANNDGIWSTTSKKIFVYIKPPFWDNIFFRLAATLLVLTLIFLYVNSKLKKIKLERERQNRFSKQLIESQEEERKRLSKELHDSLGQNLLVIKNLLHIYQSSDVREDNELENISDLIKETIGEVKEISTTLHPHQLERLGLKKALISMINKISQSVSIKFNYEIDDIAGLIPKEAEINIFRIVQESANNIIKHSQATSANILLKNRDNLIEIIVEDNGKGFDIYEKEIQGKLIEGLGLKSLKERARLLNGDFNIESSKGKGTKIIIKINKQAK